MKNSSKLAEEISETVKALLKHLNRTLLPTFLLYYGIMVLPYMIPEHTSSKSDGEGTKKSMELKTDIRLIQKLPTSFFGNSFSGSKMY